LTVLLFKTINQRFLYSPSFGKNNHHSMVRSKRRAQEEDDEEYIDDEESTAPKKGLKKVVNNCFTSTNEKFEEVLSDEEDDEEEEQQEEKKKKPAGRQPPPPQQQQPQQQHHQQQPYPGGGGGGGGGHPYHNVMHYQNPLAGRPNPMVQPQPMGSPYSGHPAHHGGYQPPVPGHPYGGVPQPHHPHPHAGAPYTGGNGGFGRGLPAATPQEIQQFGRPMMHQQQPPQQQQRQEDVGGRPRHPYQAPRFKYDPHEVFEVKTKVVFSTESLSNLAVPFRGENGGAADPPYYSNHGYLCTQITKAHVEKEWRRFIFNSQIRRGINFHAIRRSSQDMMYDQELALGKYLLPIGICWDKAFAYNMPLGFGIKVMDPFLSGMNGVYDPIGDHHMSLSCSYHPLFGEVKVPDFDRCVSVDEILALKTLGVPARNINDVIATMYEPLSGAAGGFGLSVDGGVLVKHPFSELGVKLGELGHIPEHQEGTAPSSHRVTKEQFNEAVDHMIVEEQQKYFDRGDSIEFCAVPTPVYPLSGDVRMHRGRKIHHFPVQDKRQWIGTKDDHSRIVMDNPVSFGAHATIKFAVPIKLGPAAAAGGR
jgi:hypothetical protein